jgi:hypothetical protein
MFAVQVPLPGQPPHSGLRVLPQLSVTVRVPQTAPAWMQSSLSVSGTQEPHQLGQASPQGTPSGQVPQSFTVVGVPQLFGAVSDPQYAADRSHKLCGDSGMQGQVFGLGSPHEPPFWHTPQSTVLDAPQLSVAVRDPHCALALSHSASSLSETHPQTFGCETPHITPGGQTAHWTVRCILQLSSAVSVPHCAFFDSQS